jgi:hypothetical protein
MKLKKVFAILTSIWISYSGSAQTLPTAMDIYNKMTLGWNLGNTMYFQRIVSFSDLFSVLTPL